MIGDILLPKGKTLTLAAMRISAHTQQLFVSVYVHKRQGECRGCHTLSAAVHSRYTRRLADVPCGGWSVVLEVRIRKFFCRAQGCGRRIFAEQLGEVAGKWARRTTRLQAIIECIGVALGGSMAQYVCGLLRVPVSRRVILHTIRRTVLPTLSTPRVLGVDDWALRRGQRYGTLLVDLETGRRIGLLPDRSATTLATWLQAHPGVQIISRDRAGAYAEGARQGAPGAVQVADRFHLLQNLATALTISYEAHAGLLKHLTLEQQPAPTELPSHDIPQTDANARGPSHAPQTTPVQALRDERRAVWLAKFERVHALRKEGWSIHAIARELGITRRTARKYARLPHLPKKTSPRSGPRLLDPYRAFLQQRFAEEPGLSSRQLWQESKQRGFPGGQTLVYRYWAQLRAQSGIPVKSPPAQRGPRPTAMPVLKNPPFTARMLTSLVLSRQDTLSEKQRTLLLRARQLHPHLDLATSLAQQFTTLLRSRNPHRLDSWLQQVEASGLPSLRGFASGIRRDYPAVEAALSYAWSNGPVQGMLTVSNLSNVKCLVVPNPTCFASGFLLLPDSPKLYKNPDVGKQYIILPSQTNLPPNLTEPE
jgi:transposase